MLLCNTPRFRCNASFFFFCACFLNSLATIAEMSIPLAISTLAASQSRCSFFALSDESDLLPPACLTTHRVPSLTINFSSNSPFCEQFPSESTSLSRFVLASLITPGACTNAVVAAFFCRFGAFPFTLASSSRGNGHCMCCLLFLRT